MNTDALYNTIQKEIPEEEQNNSELLKKCLLNNRYDLVVQFNEEAFTDEIFNEYKNKIIAYLNGEGQELLHNPIVIPFPNIKLNQKLFNYCIANNLDNLIPYFLISIPKEIITAKKEIFINLIGEDLPMSLSFNPYFLEYCLEQNRYDLVLQFNAKVITEEVIAQHGNEIIKTIGNKLPYNLKTSQSLFNELLMLEKYDLVIQFNQSLLTKEIIAKYENNLLPLLQNVPYNLASSSALLTYFLSHNNYEVISQFNEDAFTEEIIDQYGNSILDGLGDRLPLNLSRNVKIFQLVLNKKRFDLLKEFKGELITKELVENYGSILLDVLDFTVPYNWCKNKYLFDLCCLNKRFDLLSEFDFSLFTPEFMNEYGEQILLALPNRLDVCQLSNKVLFDYCLKKERFDLVIQFKTTLFTEEILRNNIAKIADQIGNKIPLQLENNELFFNYIMAQGRYDLLTQFNGKFLTPDIINKYSDYIFKQLYNELPSNLAKSQALLDYCLQHDKYTLVTQFDTTVLTDEIIEQYKDKIISTLKSNGSIPHHLSSNKKLFSYFLSTKNFNLVFAFDRSLLTDDVIENNIDEILFLIGDNIPYKLANNKVLFKYCLEHEMYNLLHQFSNELLTEEIVNNYGDLLIKGINEQIPFSLEKNIYLFNYCLKHEYYNLLSSFDNSLLTVKVISKYGAKILESIGPNIPFNLKNNQAFLNYLFEQKRFDIIIQFNYQFFTTSIINEYGLKLLQALNNTIPQNLQPSKNLFKYCMQQKRYDLAVQFNANIFTKEVIEKYRNELMDYIEGNYTSFIPDSLENNEYLLNKYLKNNRFDIATSFLLNKQLLDNENIMQKYAEQLGLTLNELKNKINYLYQKNDEIFNTLIPKLLSKRYSTINIEYLEKFAVYKDIQIKLLNLSDNEIKLISSLLNLINNEKYDTTAIIFYVLENIKQYSTLIQSIDYATLTQNQLKNLIAVLQSPKNIYNISSITELSDQNYQNIINAYFAQIDNKIKNNTISVEELKESLLQKKYGLSLEKAKFICERYCHNMKMLEKSELSHSIYLILEGIYDIYSSTSLEELEFLYLTSSRLKTDFYTTISLESSIRKEYAKMFSDTLYQLNPKHKLDENNELYKSNKDAYDMIMRAEYKGQKPQFYILDGDFNLQIHNLGAYRDWIRPENFKDDWERPKIAHHGICTSYISNNQIANARVRHPVYGFSEYEESALLCVGNYDLYSDESIAKFATATNKPYAFYPPKELINYTRHTHNELVLERRLNKKGETFKRKPNYVVYFVDDINNLENFSNQNVIYEETIAAAVDQNIPIIIVDRLKYAKSETKKCQDLLAYFQETLDLNALEELIVNFMNNTIACIKHLNDDREYYKYFNSYKFNNLYQRIFDFISSVDIPLDQKNQIITKFIYVLKVEYYKLIERNVPHFLQTKNIYDFETKIKALTALQNRLAINTITDSPESQNLLNKKRIIVLYYYKQPKEIQELIKSDIEQNLDVDEIIKKIQTNSYNPSKKI